MAIRHFRNQYYFLSNFFPSIVRYEGITYSSAEAAFQAQKTLDEKERAYLSNMPPSQAKQFGRKTTLREDWEEVKENLMYEIVLAKFSQNQSLRDKLLATGTEELVEENDWGDMTWGVYKGVGQNKLGKILARVREEIATLKEYQEERHTFIDEAANRYLEELSAAPAEVGKGGSGKATTAGDGPNITDVFSRAHQEWEQEEEKRVGKGDLPGKEIFSFSQGLSRTKEERAELAAQLTNKQIG